MNSTPIFDGAEEEGNSAKRKRTAGRTRAACQACRSNKQKCDAQNSFPCRRCQLYGIECVLDAGTVNGPSIQRPAAPPALPTGDAAVNDRLQDIVNRLSRIEMAVTRPLPASNTHNPASPVNGNIRSPQSTSSRSELAIVATAHSLADRFEAQDDGPLQQVRSLTANYNALSSAAQDLSEGTDAISRGIINEQMAHELFALCALSKQIIERVQKLFSYFKNLENTTMPLAAVGEDDDPDAVRRSNPFLFNTILLAAAYYTLLSSDQGRAAYHALAQLESELLGQLIVFSRARSTTLQTVRALMLNCCRKPIQRANFTGSAVPLLEQFSSKLDPAGSAMQLHLALGMAYFLGLRKRVMQIIEDAGISPPSEADNVLCRTWFGLCLIDLQGALGTGRLPSAEAVDEDHMLDRWVQADNTPGNVRLAATLACGRIGREARLHLYDPSRRDGGVASHAGDLRTLRDFQGNYARWRDIWLPRIRTSRYNWNVSYINGPWHHVILLARYVSIWAEEYKQNGASRPYAAFSEEQREVLQSTIKSAVEALFSLSVEARTADNPNAKAVSWKLLPGQEHKTALLDVEPLTPDPEMVQLLALSIDTMSCIVIPYFALFLASQVGRSMRCDLNTMTPDRILQWQRPTWMNPKGKLRRLLDLTADTLEGAAPNPTHPVVGHARMIRSLIEKSMRNTPPEDCGERPGGEFGGADDHYHDSPPISLVTNAAFSAPAASPFSTAIPDYGGAAPFDYASLFGVSIAGSDGIDWSSFGLGDTFDGAK